ncbi:MAG: TetR/AcrR family transcriptional regulator, partial [Spirochaetota bacterium]
RYNRIMNIEWDDEESGRDHKRQELVEIAAKLFRQKGFKKTKLDEIASRGEKGKTALYYYFKNKKSIFTAVIDWEVSHIYREIESFTLVGKELDHFVDGGTFDSLAALERYVEKIVEIGDTFLRKHKSSFAEYAAFQKLIQSIIKAFKEQNIILLSKILTYGVEQEQLDLSGDAVDLAAYAIFRICFTYYTDIMQGLDFQVRSVELKKMVRLIALNHK